MSIDILMASYNSEKYIEEQIKSILAQDIGNWRLIVRDDASHDRTPVILKHYAEKYPEKVTVALSNQNIGAKANFNELLKLSTAQYVMFADHDDVWLPQKVSITLQRMTETESKYGKDTPLLVFTDKSLTDEFLNVTAVSSSQAEKLDTENIELNRLLVQNIASGCTIMINRKLAEVCGTIPNAAIVHDYWLVLLAAVFGKIEYVDNPLMLYRQHSNNEIGAKSYGINYIINKLQKRGRANINHNIAQAQALIEKYGNRVPKDSTMVLHDFIKLTDASPLDYRLIIIRNRFFKKGLARNVGLLLRLKS